MAERSLHYESYLGMIEEINERNRAKATVRTIVFHQKMVERRIAPLSKDRDAMDIPCDFRGDRHASLLNRTSYRPFYFDFPPTSFFGFAAASASSIGDAFTPKWIPA